MSGRTIVVACIAASVLLALLHALLGGGFGADRLKKRIHELEAREAKLYEQLAQKDAQRESQRRIYIDRIRKGEAQLREHAVEIMVLRGNSVARSTTLAAPPTSRD